MLARRIAALGLASGLLYAHWAGADSPDPKLVVPHLKRPLIAAHLAPTEKRIRVARSLKVSQVTGTIDLKSAHGRALMVHTLANREQEDMEVRARMDAAATQQVMLPAAGNATVRFQSPVPVTREGKHLRSVRVAPQLVVDDSLLLEPVDESIIEVKLPDDAKKIVKSNKTLVPVEDNDGSLTYRWLGSGEYLTPLVLWWTTSETDLSIDKVADPDWENGTVSVALKIRNNGADPARGVVLKENFPTQIYTADATSGGEFTLYKGEVNDTRLLWEYAMPELAAGEEFAVDYTLRIDPGLRVAGLHETHAVQNGEPVALSDAVRVRRPVR